MLVLHGGPGSGGSPRLAGLFDPARCRVIVPDQRGAGRSEPAGATRANTRPLRQRPPESVPMPMPPDTSGLAGKHVLLVEDSLINQEVALSLLEGVGLKVDVASLSSGG